MNYRRIYNSLINKRLYREVISQDEIGQNHHIIPKCLGGTEMVRLTIREHIFAHELLVLIYKNEEPNDKAYKCMLTSIVFLYKAKDKRPDWDNTSFHKSRLIEKWILESYNIRKNRTKIKNIKLKKTKWWDASKPLTDKMINDGWEYGQYLNDDQTALRSKQSRNRIWVYKHGCPDKMIDPKLLDEYVAQGWIQGRLDLPDGFSMKQTNRLKHLHKVKDIRIDGIMKNFRWICNHDADEERVIKKTEPIPSGWMPGRIPRPVDETEIQSKIEKFQTIYKFFMNHNEDFDMTKRQFNLTYDRHYFLAICRKYVPSYQTVHQKRKSEVDMLFEEYTINGFTGCVKNLGYSKSWEHLRGIFKSNKKPYTGYPKHFHTLNI